MCLTSRDVEDNIVAVGDVLYLDISHASLPSEIVKKLCFSKVSVAVCCNVYEMTLDTSVSSALVPACMYYSVLQSVAVCGAMCVAMCVVVCVAVCVAMQCALQCA